MDTERSTREPLEVLAGTIAKWFVHAGIPTTPDMVLVYTAAMLDVPEATFLTLVQIFKDEGLTGFTKERLLNLEGLTDENCRALCIGPFWASVLIEAEFEMVKYRHLVEDPSAMVSVSTVEQWTDANAMQQLFIMNSLAEVGIATMIERLELPPAKPLHMRH